MALGQIIEPFAWGSGGRKLSPEQIAREREIAAALGAVDTSPVGHWLQGAARLANAASGRIREGRADRAERENATYNSEIVSGLLGGMGGGATGGYAGGNPVAAALTGGASAPVDPASARVAQAHGVPSGERASYIRQGLVQRGLPEHVADAFLVNFQDESGLDPNINERNPIVPGSRGGFGLYQLTGPRRRQYEAFASERGVPLGDIDAQLDFLMMELQGPESRAAQNILGAQDTATAAQAIVNDFLRPAPEHRQSRTSRYAQLGGGTPAQAALESLAVGDSMQMPSVANSLVQPQQTQEPVQVANASGINPAIIQALSDPRANDGTRQIASLLLNQQMQSQDPMRALEMQIAQEKLNQMRNPISEPTDTMRNLEWRAQQAGLQPGTQEYTQFMMTGGRNDGITVNNMGNIPAGYQLATDPQTGAQRMEPIPGSPAAQEVAEAERMRGEREGQGQRYGRIVLEDIGRVLEAVESNPNLVAGPLGSMLSNLPGTGAHDVSSMLNTIRANVGFDRLQAMRASSPTGGALGAVSDSENKMLQSTLGALEQSQSSEQFARNLRRLQNLYTEIVHGPAPSGVSDDEWSRRAWSDNPSQPSSNRPLSEMTDEELEAIINGNR